MIQKIILYFAGIVVIFSTNSCMPTKSQKPEIESVDLKEQYYLSDSDLALAKKKAIMGDNEAAFKVAMYYDIAKMDSYSGIGWLLLAANNGYVDAQTLLGSSHLKGHSLENFELAEYWFKRAAKNGSKYAKRILKQLDNDRQNIVKENEKVE